ncbi:hypothetical protein ASPZODRAFT_1388379 [Penicilliopsis zonata CBS 506.65]|uniref:Uncharacterized protein n=1 Tax=Penicilliopsis zonata CBS 506.65 TaxID=1073090 RepID=A0A1L9SPS6_9EURO|nr:hypothetical protein ASPZODRAFT_1388379 [Penicilliopsis zonata CBS 506.65]OJJ49064.1 hypothetical protein ASPZODRAFT_1388379 [Penicilliopsis zonata CBS 506.65]
MTCVLAFACREQKRVSPNKRGLSFSSILHKCVGCLQRRMRGSFSPWLYTWTEIGVYDMGLFSWTRGACSRTTTTITTTTPPASLLHSPTSASQRPIGVEPQSPVNGLIGFFIWFCTQETRSLAAAAASRDKRSLPMQLSVLSLASRPCWQRP